ncbi:MAG: hypothetical protein ABEJ02_01645 [Candidatus Paceibacteria bacterium]
MMKKREEAKQFFDQSLQTFKDFAEIYKQAYNDAESRLQDIHEEKSNLNEQYENLRQRYQNQIENSKEKLRNPAGWTDYIKGSFGLGKGWFGKRFSDVNYNIDKQKLNFEESSLNGRKKTIDNNFDKVVKNYEELRMFKERLNQAEANATNYILRKKTPYSSSSTQGFKEMAKSVGDFFGF